MMPLSIDEFSKTLAELTPKKQLCIAYSGGVDSHVLLALAAALPADYAVRAVHINHGLSDHAAAWDQHCAETCAALNVPFTCYPVTVIKQPGDSLEALAREARYQVFSEILQKDEVLLTAHNADDQVETVLLQLLRGAGVLGLSAMPVCKPFSCSELVRPLLGVSRACIEDYARQHHLNWVEDESNQDHQFSRNYLRHSVIPLIKQRWPNALTTIERSAYHCQQAAELIDSVAKADCAQAQNADGSLSISVLTQWNQIRQRELLRYWIRQQQFELPSSAQMQQIFQCVIGAKIDAMPYVEWAGQQLRRYQGQLYLVRKDAVDYSGEVQTIEFGQPVSLPGDLGQLSFRLAGEADDQPLQLRFRQGGEKIKPKGHAQTHTLRKLFQQWQIPPWQRDHIPLIFHGKTLVAVVGYCVADGYQIDYRN